MRLSEASGGNGAGGRVSVVSLLAPPSMLLSAPPAVPPLLASVPPALLLSPPTSLPLPASDRACRRSLPLIPLLPLTPPTPLVPPPDVLVGRGAPAVVGVSWCRVLALVRARVGVVAAWARGTRGARLGAVGKAHSTHNTRRVAALEWGAVPFWCRE